MDQIFRAQQDDNPIDANRMREQVRQLRRRVDELAELVIPHDTPICSDVPRPGIHRFIRTILKLRANRRKVFGADLFGEASWDMLLELYDADFTGRRISVSSLCFASGVPQTTALRWIKILEREGQIKRTPDPRDGRRYFVELTESARTALDRTFVPLNLPET
jgi:DNA-binding MarR family transcriptional regulator